MDIAIILAVLATAGTTGIGVTLWLFFRSKKDGKRAENAREQAKNVLSQAEEEKRKVLLAAQEEVINLRTAGEQEIKEQRQELTRLERRFQQREEHLETKTEALEKQQVDLTQQQGKVEETLREAEELKVKRLHTLEEKARKKPSTNCLAGITSWNESIRPRRTKMLAVFLH